MSEEHLQEELAGLPISRLVDLWCDYLRSLGRSDRTITFYRAKTDEFSSWYVGTFGRELTLGVFTANVFRAFINDKRAKPKYDGHPCHTVGPGPVSNSYLAGYFRTLRAFGSWLADPDAGGMLPENPMRGLKTPKAALKEIPPGASHGRGVRRGVIRLGGRTRPCCARTLPWDNREGSDSQTSHTSTRASS